MPLPGQLDPYWPSFRLSGLAKLGAMHGARDASLRRGAAGRAVRPEPRFSPNELLDDYRVAYGSRIASLLAYRDVMTGRAKFGILGDGKEVPQVAMARTFNEGDWRAGYYRDQTFMFATGMLTARQFFAQLYADTNIQNDPASGGRLMGCHFATRLLNPDGTFRNQLLQGNCSAPRSQHTFVSRNGTEGSTRRRRYSQW